MLIFTHTDARVTATLCPAFPPAAERPLMEVRIWPRVMLRTGCKFTFIAPSQTPFFPSVVWLQIAPSPPPLLAIGGMSLRKNELPLAIGFTQVRAFCSNIHALCASNIYEGRNTVALSAF